VRSKRPINVLDGRAGLGGRGALDAAASRSRTDAGAGRGLGRRTPGSVGLEQPPPPHVLRR
jgi:hypothetical protein